MGFVAEIGSEPRQGVDPNRTNFELVQVALGYEDYCRLCNHGPEFNPPKPGEPPDKWDTYFEGGRAFALNPEGSWDILAHYGEKIPNGTVRLNLHLILPGGKHTGIFTNADISTEEFEEMAVEHGWRIGEELE